MRRLESTRIILIFTFGPPRTRFLRGTQALCITAYAKTDTESLVVGHMGPTYTRRVRGQRKCVAPQQFDVQHQIAASILIRTCQ